MTSFFGTSANAVANDGVATMLSEAPAVLLPGILPENLDSSENHRRIARARWERRYLIVWFTLLAELDLSLGGGCCECDSVGLCDCSDVRKRIQPNSRVLVGSDFSEVLHALRNNVTSYDVDGSEKDPLAAVVSTHGYKWARLRIMVDPPGNHGLNQDLPYVKDMTLSIEKLGMHLLLDFHFSHWLVG